MPGNLPLFLCFIKGKKSVATQPACGWRMCQSTLFVKLKSKFHKMKTSKEWMKELRGLLNLTKINSIISILEPFGHR